MYSSQNLYIFDKVLRMTIVDSINKSPFAVEPLLHPLENLYMHCMFDKVPNVLLFILTNFRTFRTGTTFWISNGFPPTVLRVAHDPLPENRFVHEHAP
jgi:hypothetical protein